MEPVAQLNSALAGRYEIERELGSGGMATVYLARDIRHDRHVALKVLNPDLGVVVGPERFLAEIKVTANLQHPNLLPLFDSGEATAPGHRGGSGGTGLLFYVMPYVDGESLRARLAREKQLPVDEAVRIAVAVASALEYAHAQGVIHRDLKPENILLQAGQPVVADFGIALAVSRAGGARITQTGISLGTPQYMSPEQATGDRVIDGRTDIYSLGAVLYEMLTGEPPHTGSTAQAIIARVLTETPRSARSTRANVPAHVDFALERSLEKLPADRFASAQDFAEALEGRAPVQATSRAGRDTAARRVAILAACLVLSIAIALWGWLRVPSVFAGRTGAPAMQFVVVAPRATRFVEPAPAISPDGRLLVFVGADSTGQAHLWLRPLDRLDARVIPGTEEGTFPFWSPRSDAVGFFSHGKLRIVPLNGGPAQIVSDAPRAWGGSWSTDDVILFSPDLRSPIYVVRASGGERKPVTTLENASGTQQFPAFLSDGRHFVYIYGGAVYLSGIGESTATRLRAVSTISPVSTNAVPTANGYLVFPSGGTLQAQRLDVGSKRLIGSSFPIVGGLNPGAPANPSQMSSVSVSRNGVVAYQYTGQADKQLRWVDRSGRVLEIVGPPGSISAPALSPDETKVAFGRDGDIWIADLSRPATPTRLTDDPAEDFYPTWSPDGLHIVFSSVRAGPEGLYLKLASGVGDERRIADGIASFEWSADGRFLTFFTTSAGTGDDAYVLRMGNDTAVVPFLKTRFNEYEHRLSRDGKWMVYVTDESGTPEVWVTTFPASDRRARVSTAGGVQPIWAGNAPAIYYLALDGKIMVADIALSPELRPGIPRALFQMNSDILYSRSSYAPTRDGQRFLVNSFVNIDGPTIGVVTNWPALISRP